MLIIGCDYHPGFHSKLHLWMQKPGSSGNGG